MINCVYVKDPVSGIKKQIVVSENSTPYEIIKLLDFNPNELPTLCVLMKKGSEPKFLCRDGWDSPVPEGHDCYFIAYPRYGPEGPLIIAIVSLVVSVAITVYSILSRPEIPENQNKQEQSPTYGLSNLQNSARLDEPVPVQYGRVRSYPDLASPYYTMIDNNDEILYGRLCLGHGYFEFDVDDIRIDDTPLNGFKDYTVAILDPGESPGFFTREVETSKDVANIMLEDDDWVGPFVVNRSGTSIEEIVVDFEFKRGIYESDNDGSLTSHDIDIEVRAMEIDNNGDDVGTWFTTATANFASDTPVTYDVQRRSITLNSGSGTMGSSGRYKIQVKRTSLPSTDPKIQDQVTLTRVKGFSEDAIQASPDKTIIIFNMRASEQLNNQNSNILNIEATRKINTYSKGSPVFEASSSPVWAFYDLATNSTYGAGLDPARLNLSELIALDNALTSNLMENEPPIECNIRFETSASAMELLAQIAQSARCQIYQRAGRLLMVRDSYNQTINGFFTPDNIAEDSLTIDWAPRSKLSPNYIELSYFDEVTWQIETVQAVWPGETPLIKEEIKIMAITNRTRAWMEAMHYLAQDRLRRKTINFETDAEGYLPNFFDRISISHPSLSSHVSGVVEDISGGSIYLSNPVDFGGYGYGFLTIKNPNGSVYGPIVVGKGVSDYIVNPIGISLSRSDFPVSKICDDREPAIYSFGTREATVYAIVKSLAPSGDNKVSISCVVDDTRVYTFGRDFDNAPPLGTDYIEVDAFIFSDQVAEFDADTDIVTVEWQGQSYDKYKITFTYNVVNSLVTESVTQDADITTSNTLVHTPGYAGESPIQVSITPIVEIDGEDVEYTEITAYAVLTIVNCD